MDSNKYDLEMCAWCYGRGRQSGSEKCTVCGGKGKLMVLQPPHRCLECNCTGRSGISLETCVRCHGSGWEGVLETAREGNQT